MSKPLVDDNSSFEPLVVDNSLLLLSEPLVYDDTISTSSIQRVLFVNSGASPLETYANATTFTIIYDYSSSLEDIWELMRRKFPGGHMLSRVGFAFHNHWDLTSFYHKNKSSKICPT